MLPPHFAAIAVRLSFELVILLIMEEYAEIDGLLAAKEPIIPLTDVLEPKAFLGFTTPNIPLLQWVGTAQWKIRGFVSLTTCV